MEPAFGVDFGGSGVKAAPVDLVGGTLAAPRSRIPTPHPATPDAVATVVEELVRAAGWTGVLGCAVPAAVRDGVVRTAANIDPSWIGVDVAELLAGRLGQPVVALNDADAAGIAEAAYGAARGRDGVVVVVTLGTGIGTAVFTDGTLVPNTELGHLEIRGKPAERRAADSVRRRRGLSWKEWARRVDEYLGVLHRLLGPDLFVLGGGVSRQAHRWLHHLNTPVETVPARLANEAGIVGAALATRHAVALGGTAAGPGAA